MTKKSKKDEQVKEQVQQQQPQVLIADLYTMREVLEKAFNCNGVVTANNAEAVGGCYRRLNEFLTMMEQMEKEAVEAEKAKLEEKPAEKDAEVEAPTE